MDLSPFYDSGLLFQSMWRKNKQETEGQDINQKVKATQKS